MIRTRDFLLFGAVLLFLFTGVSVTVLMDAWQSPVYQNAAVVQFNETKEVTGADTVKEEINRADNAERLRNKLARGDGNVAGGPVFTSVDDLIVASSTAITDQTVPESIMIGTTVDGAPLMSDDLWRFVGFAQIDQVGVALDNRPIYGSRQDGAPLDACGGVDEGSGYRYYIQPGKEIAKGCFTGGAN